MEPNSPTPTPTAPIAPKNNLLIPLSIIIAGLLIGGGLFLGIFLSKGSTTTGPVVTRPVNQHLEKNLKPVTAADHIRGSASAPIVLVEYSDTDCYYCNRFHGTMTSIMSTYGKANQVAWVYRHFNTGIPSHPHTEIEAIASECIAELSGNDTFWKFIDLMFSKKDFESSPAKLIEPSTLPTHAASLGVNKAQFTQCLNDQKYKSKVAEMTLDAQTSGGQGTPFNILISKAKISKDLEAFIEQTNLQAIGGETSTAPDALYVSEDKHMIVLSGAMPLEIMTVILDMLVKDNS
ncbi:MAG: oxidoreductase [Candidatus Paceibacter sp.]|jgi:protein-disulfide isomerase|nr:oxidoreductase [Candidatus Paceibacter sp.]